MRKPSFQKGANNSHWKGGKPLCRVCGKQLTTYHSTRCRACSLEDKKLLKIRKEQFIGKRNPRWKGGITTLTHIIRCLPESQKWRNEVFSRDEYKCVDCGSSGYLEAHHIKAFTKLFKDFTNLYSQFSVVDDKDILVRLALTYLPFFDVANGKSLCEKCHETYRIEAGRDTQETSDSFSVGQTTSEEACK